MIVFGNSISPFVRKVTAYCTEKGIEFELKAGGMGRGGPEFAAASPFGKMPAMSDGDFTLADSSAILHYLEAKHPEPNLIPTDPQARGRAVWFDEFADTIFTACGTKMFFNRFVAPKVLKRDGDMLIADAAERDELPPLLDYLETQVQASGFLVEDRLTIADIAVASPFVNLQHVDVALDAARHPKTAAYVKAILARPSFARQIEMETRMVAAMA
jgi:glutathione S-transferase